MHARSHLGAPVICAVAITAPAHADAFHPESGAPGTIGVPGGATVDADNDFGRRFAVDEHTVINGPGAHIVGGDNTVFAALLDLNTDTADPPEPVGLPFTQAEIIAAEAFEPPAPGDLHTASIEPVILQPGTCGVVFGSGEFGATGTAKLPSNQVSMSGETFLRWQGALATPQWTSANSSLRHHFVTGYTSDFETCPRDANHDFVVDFDDLNAAPAHWGENCL